jgi:hypothetical protein
MTSIHEEEIVDTSDYNYLVVLVGITKLEYLVFVNEAKSTCVGDKIIALG